MRRILSILLSFAVIGQFLISPSHLNAQNAVGRFILNPKSGQLAVGQNFTLDIFIDSGGGNVSLARAVVTFDPTLVQVTGASRNNSLFTNFDEDEQTLDNTNGVIMVTGFTQSGAGTLYKTQGEPDLLARLTFKVLKAGPLRFDWEYSGQDQPFKSVMIADGSPPQNILTTKPESASFPIPTTGTTPSTGLNSWSVALFGGGIIGGSLLIWAGSSLISRGFKRQRKTQVLYE